MAHKCWVVDASPLILLGKTGQLGLLCALADQIAVPRAVAEEVGAKSDGDRTLQAISALESFVIVDDEVPLSYTRSEHSSLTPSRGEGV